MKIRDYTLKLSYDDLLEIINNTNKWEAEGKIGDCLLRTIAEKIVIDIGDANPPIVLWMNEIAHDCYRLIAEKAIESGFKF